MGNTALVNKNAGENIVCWNCEHFQPSRDPSTIPRAPLRGAKAGIDPEPTNYCNGECRKNPPAWHYEQLQAGVQVYDARGYFPFVPLGNTAWCSGFQRAIEPLPAPVVSGAGNCSDLLPVNWAIPTVNDSINTYRKVPAENSCWYCEHFQPDCGNGSPQSQTCAGFCQKDPPNVFIGGIVDGTPPTLEQQYHWPKIDFSYYKWCSKWERSRKAVPAPPDFEGTPCAPVP